MSVIDTERLLQEVSAETPCGEDPEYAPEFQEMERAAQGRPEAQMGDEVREAEPPDWRDVKVKANAVLDNCRDLRALVLLARASLNTDGWEAFSDCVMVIKELLENQWDHVHPQPDPDDGDATLRANSIIGLCDQQSMIRDLRETPLVSSRVVGRYNLRHVDLANDVPGVSLREEETKPTLEIINAAFMDTDNVDVEVLIATAEALQSAANNAKTIEAILTDKIGSSEAPSLSELVQELNNGHSFVSEKLAKRGVASGGAPAQDAAGSAIAAGATAQSRPMMGGSGQAISGDIQSRADVAQMLDKIIFYYSNHEPSSPVPILLQRARGLLDKSFMDVIRNIAPGAMNQVKALQGPDSSNSSAPAESSVAASSDYTSDTSSYDEVASDDGGSASGYI